MLYEGKNHCFSKLYLLHTIDSFGRGGRIGGGLIYALLNGCDIQNAVTVPAAAADSCRSAQRIHAITSVATTLFSSFRPVILFLN